jgi:6-phosphogluconolactonase (cycloisomerase 2 family)
MSFCVLTACTSCGGSGSQTTSTGTAPPPSAQSYAYITYILNGDTDLGELMAYSESAGKLTAIGNAISFPDACGLTVSPNNKFLYVAICGSDLSSPSGVIQPYSINSSTGQLTVVGSGTAVNIPGPSGGFITPLVMAPNGKFAYVVNEGAAQQSVVIYSVGSDGSLSAVGSPAVFNNNGWLHISLAIAPSGDFVYVAYWGLGQVYAYAVDTNSGGLTAVSGSPFALNDGTIGAPASYDPIALAVATTGNYIYAPDSDGSISMFSVASGTGALTAMSFYYVNQGNTGGPMVMNSAGTQAYMQCTGSGWVTAYSVNTASGALNQTGLTKGSLVNGSGIALDPSGTYLYALWTENPSASGGEGEVSTYSVDSSSGALTYVGPATGSSNTWPTGIAFATE